MPAPAPKSNATRNSQRVVGVFQAVPSAFTECLESTASSRAGSVPWQPQMARWQRTVWRPRVLVDVPSLRHGHYELDMGFEDLLHDIGISRGPPAIRSSEQDQYTLSTSESPIPDDEWSSFVDPAPLFPNYGQVSGRKQSYTSLESAYSLYETVTESTEHTRFLVDALSGPSSGPSPSQASSLSSASRGWQPPSIDHNQSPQHLRSSGNPISQQSPQQQQSQPHSCYNLTSSALESLRLETRYDCSKKRALDGPNQSQLPILNLDHILEANKLALGTLQQTMDCKCLERHAPLAFLHASIFSKAIFWYQVAGRIIRSAATPIKSQSRFVSSPNSALPDDCAHGRSRGTPVSSSFSPRTLESLSISIGHFDVDAEDRATLSQHLLLTELRKAAALAAGFRCAGAVASTVTCKTGFTFIVGTKVLLRHIDQGCLAYISQWLFRNS